MFENSWKMFNISSEDSLNWHQNVWKSRGIRVQFCVKLSDLAYFWHEKSNETFSLLLNYSAPFLGILVKWFKIVAFFSTFNIALRAKRAMFICKKWENHAEFGFVFLEIKSLMRHFCWFSTIVRRLFGDFLSTLQSSL